MKRAAITIARPQSVHVRLTDVQDAGFVQINEYHFDLRVGTPENVLVALHDGLNVARFVVTTRRFRERVLDLALDRPHWHGRFELLIDGAVVSVFAGEGAALLGGGTHLVAHMDLTLFDAARPPRAEEVVTLLRHVPGMTHTDSANLVRSRRALRFRNDVAVHTWKNPFGVDFVYVCDSAGDCVYAGYVGWVHAGGLRRAVERLRQDYAATLA